MARLTSIPIELIIDNILPLLPLSDISRLSATCKFFYLLTSDEAFWHRKLSEDFNFSGNDTARTTGWRFIYKRLAKPKVYVWGEFTRRRLGMHPNTLPKTSVPDGVPYPIRLRMPRGVRIVGLVAGGMSFHALDSQGRVYVWGVLDGTSGALQAEGYADPSQPAQRPIQLDLPFAIRSISCARLYSAALTTESQVVTFTSWGRPFVLHSSHFASSLQPAHVRGSLPIQVECGWNFTAVLTQAGDVFVYWPRAVFHDVPGTSRALGRHVHWKNEEFNNLEGTERQTARAELDAASGTVKCWVWEVDSDAPPEYQREAEQTEDAAGQQQRGQMLVKLPDLPVHDLPDIHVEGDDRKRAEGLKLVKVAGLDCHLIGLTNKGHVVRFRWLADEEDASAAGRKWEYLPYFSEVEKVQEDPVWTDDANGLRPPSAMHITHISGHFKTFTAYSTGSESVVLTGNIDADPAVNRTVMPSLDLQFKPSILPSLQAPHNSVISVFLGDYHYGCLTSTGKLLTWGQFSKGALGLGDPLDIEVGRPGGYKDERVKSNAERLRGTGHQFAEPDSVRVPTEVRFDWQETKRNAQETQNQDGQTKGKETYCFAATASGWHMGALVIDLEPEADDEDEEDVADNEPLPMPGAFPRSARPSQHRWPVDPMEGATPPFIPIRLGYPARGGFHTMGGAGRRDHR